MLQEAQQQGGVSTRTQFFMSEVSKAMDEDHGTAWQFIQDPRSVERHHCNIPNSYILLDSQSRVNDFINCCPYNCRSGQDKPNQGCPRIWDCLVSLRWNCKHPVPIKSKRSIHCDLWQYESQCIHDA